MHKKALTVAIAGALAAPLAAHAVDFTVSGHVNQALVFTDVDGGDSTAQFKDHGSSGSRVRFTGSSETMAGVTAGVNMEFGVNAASGVSVRHTAVSLGGEFGTLSLGHTSEAADGTTYHDKSTVLGIGHGQETGGSKTRAALYAPGMGGGRNAGLHFSSAAFGPASFAFSVSNDDRFSVKLSVGGDAGVASYTGSLAYLDTGTSVKPADGTNYEEIAGGLGVKLASGVTFSVAGGARSSGDDASFMQSTLGYVFGNNGVGVSYYASSDVTPAPLAGAEPLEHPHVTSTPRLTGDGTAIGVGFIHTMPKAAVDIIASVQQFSADFDDSSKNMDDTVAIIGTRVKF